MEQMQEQTNKEESEILAGTKEFAKAHKIRYNKQTDGLVLNANI